ncbi:hypothetical protein GGF31_002525 [Allomyces arbusculus]|nr:hypothetical protein GGF31_002525 [Allomyces arbusculus]
MLLSVASTHDHACRAPSPFALTPSSVLGVDDSRASSPAAYANESIISAYSTRSSTMAGAAHRPGRQRGWCSARNCTYPQWLVLVVGTETGPPPDITTIQILVHHFKIPSRIEIWTGSRSKNADDAGSLGDKTVSWTKYGHVTLSPNTASRFRARELKVIPVSMRGTSLLKLVLHANHPNELNLWNQVALEEVRFFGPQPSPSPPAPLVPWSLATPVPVSTDPHPGAPSRFSLGYTALQEIEARKAAAVAHEDYAAAAAIKACGDRLLDTLQQLERCQSAVSLACAREEYAEADVWRARLRQVESELDAVLLESRAPPGPRANVVLPSASPVPPSPVQMTVTTAVAGSAIPLVPVVAGPKPNLAAAEPLTPPPPPPSGRDVPPGPVPVEGDGRACALAVTVPTVSAADRAKSPPIPTVRKALADGSFQALLDSLSADNASSTSPPSAPTPAGPAAGSSSPRKSTTFPRKPEPRRSRDNLKDGKPRSDPNLSPSRPAQSQSLDEPTLTDEQRVDYRLVIDAIGEALTARFLAREFGTKEASFQAILALFAEPVIRHPETNEAVDMATVIKGTFTLIETTLADSRERVASWGIALWRTLTNHPSMTLASLPAPAASLYHSLTQVHWPALLLRTADANARAARTAHDLAVHLLTQHPSWLVGPMVRQFPPPTVPWRQLRARLDLITATVPILGIDVTDDDGGSNSSFASTGAASGSSATGPARPASRVRDARKRTSIAARAAASVSVTGRARESKRPSRPGSVLAAPTDGEDARHYPLWVLRHLLHTFLPHMHSAVRDAAADLLVAVAHQVGPAAVQACVHGLAQRSQVQALRTRLDRIPTANFDDQPVGPQAAVANVRERARSRSVSRSRPLSSHARVRVRTQSRSRSRSKSCDTRAAAAMSVSTRTDSDPEENGFQLVAAPTKAAAVAAGSQVKPTRLHFSGIPEPSASAVLARPGKATLRKVASMSGPMLARPQAGLRAAVSSDAVPSSRNPVRDDPTRRFSMLPAPSTAAGSDAKTGAGRPVSLAARSSLPSLKPAAAAQPGRQETLAAVDTVPAASTKGAPADTTDSAPPKSGFWGRFFGGGQHKAKVQDAHETVSAQEPATSTVPPVVPSDVTVIRNPGTRPQPVAPTGPAAAPAPASPGPTTTAAAANTSTTLTEDDDNEWNLDMTCVFCDEKNPEFTAGRLDFHYWRECPMLMECTACHTIVEVAEYRKHLLKECTAPNRPSPKVAAPVGMCPLCGGEVGRSARDMKRHLLLGGGCPKATRKPRAAAVAGPR